MEMADTVRSAAGRVPAPVKADGNEPPAALRAAVPAGGRRSKPFPRFFAVGDARSRCVAEQGVLFRALVDAGAEATVARPDAPLVAEIRQMREGMVTKADLAGFAAKADLADLSRKIDVLAARLDGLKVLGQVMLGAFALLITALIAVFGFLFTN